MGKIRWVSTATLHEAAHVVMAREFGRGDDVVVHRDARRGRPGTEISLAGLDVAAVAVILLAGMAAERRVAREVGDEPNLEDLKRAGMGDLAFLRGLGIRVTDLGRALDTVEGMLAERWDEVLQTAVSIQAAWDAGRDWTPDA